jgi:PAS domain S-box-containing protein
VRDFIRKAAQRLDKLDKDQIGHLVFDLMDDNEMLEMVLSSLDRGIIVANNQFKVTLVNRHIRRFVPLKSTNPMEQTLWEIIEDPQIAQFVQEVLINEDNIREKHFNLDMKGRTIILSLSLLPLVKEGRVRGNLLYAEDITKKKAEEARMRRVESLVSLTTLTAGIAHEIKNPLGSIGIYLQLMQKVLNNQCGGCKGELLGYLDVLNEEVERLNSIVVDYLFAVKPLDTNLEPSDINKVIEELVEFVHFELEQQGIVIKLSLDKQLPCLYLDEKLMKQVLLNLVKNAAAAMEAGGRLTISTSQESDNVCIAVSDTGVGIPEDLRAKIFEPYFTTKDTGTGLGLTLVYKIVKEHGGDMEVESSQGRGATFSVILPMPQGDQRLLTWREDSNDL